MNITSVLASKGTEVFVARPEDTLREALAVLAANGIGALIVVDHAGHPIGILSERDIVREAARNERLFETTVGAIMTRDLVVAEPADDLHSVATLMTQHHIRHLPIVHAGELVGMLSIRDVMMAQRDHYEGEVDTLQIQLLADTTSSAQLS